MKKVRNTLKGTAAFLLASLTTGALLAAGTAAPAMWAGQRVLDAGHWWDSIEVDTSVFDEPLPQRTYLTYANGQPMATLYTENRLPVKDLGDISTEMIQAVLSVEDRRFYDRGPIDLASTARALATNSLNGTSHGGSTISQQYVKLLRAAAGDTPLDVAEATDQTLGRKIVELKYAIELEATYTKDQILLGYLNIAYFGSGTYGVGAAARHYFDTTPDKLDVAQSAMLAGLLRNPVAYDPGNDPQATKARRNVALDAMASNDVITADQARELSQQPLGAGAHRTQSGCTEADFPLYCDWVRATLLSDPAFGDDEAQRAENLRRGGMTVTTAADPKKMTALQDRLEAEIPDQPVAAAIATIEPGTGIVPAIAQTVDYDDSQFSIPIQGQLQTGSVFKPITYAAALHTGAMTPSTHLDSPTGYTPATGSAPPGGFTNYDHRSHGPTTPDQALGRSLNTWFIKAAQRTGTAAVADMAHQMGMQSMDPATRNVGEGDWSLTLGAFETTVLDTANTYATLAAEGVACRPVSILAVTETATGDELPAPGPQCQQVMHPEVANQVTADLAATAEQGGTAEDIDVPGVPWRGKTGTSNRAGASGAGATWFAGYTPELAGAVWLGDPRGPSHPVQNVQAFGQVHRQVYGSTIAAPLWAMAMGDLTDPDATGNFTRPGTITSFGQHTPQVVGLSEAAARTIAEQHNLIVATEDLPGSGAPPGTVVDQGHTGDVLHLTVAADEGGGQ